MSSTIVPRWNRLSSLRCPVPPGRIPFRDCPPFPHFPSEARCVRATPVRPPNSAWNALRGISSSDAIRLRRPRPDSEKAGELLALAALRSRISGRESGVGLDTFEVLPVCHPAGVSRARHRSKEPDRAQPTGPCPGEPSSPTCRSGGRPRRRLHPAPTQARGRRREGHCCPRVGHGLMRRMVRSSGAVGVRRPRLSRPRLRGCRTSPANWCALLPRCRERPPRP